MGPGVGPRVVSELCESIRSGPHREEGAPVQRGHLRREADQFNFLGDICIEKQKSWILDGRSGIGLHKRRKTLDPPNFTRVQQNQTRGQNVVK